MLHLGENTKAQHLITKYKREWEKIKDTSDNGFFGTTPFFISFTDDPKRLRRAQYLYFASLADEFTGNEVEAKNKVTESISLNNENLFCLYYNTFGFLN